jgi:hypothetical protein
MNTLTSAAGNDAGLLVGFVLSLLIFSYLIKDTVLARLAQYVLVGASLGYAGVLAIKNVLWPRLVTPLLLARAGEPTMPPLLGSPLLSWWLPLLLGALLWLSALEFMRRPPGPGSSIWRRWLRLVGTLPLGLLLGTGVGVGIAGAIQGTLGPQFLRAAQIGIPAVADTGLLTMGILTLVITGGTLLYLHTDRSAIPKRGPGWLIGPWRWIGQRALWLAAGVIFARLVAARLSLLIARIDYFTFSLPNTSFWQWLLSVLHSR